MLDNGKWAKAAILIAKKLEFSINLKELFALEQYLKENSNLFSSNSLKCYVISGDVTHAFILAASEVFDNVILLNPSHIESFNKYLDEDCKIKIEELPLNEAESSLYFFNDNEVYIKYHCYMNKLSLAITKQKHFQFLDSIIILGKKNEKYLTFWRLEEWIIEKNIINGFNMLENCILNYKFQAKLKKIIDFIQVSKDSGTEIIWNEKSEEFLIYFQELKNITEKIKQIDRESIINELHFQFLHSNLERAIQIFIKYVVISFSNYANETIVALVQSQTSFISKFKFLFKLCNYSLSKLLADVILNPLISELIVTCFYEIMNGVSKNFISLQDSKMKNIKFINKKNYPAYFSFIKTVMRKHLGNLLDNGRINSGYIELDSFVIEAETIQIATEKLSMILQCQSFITNITDYSITQINENQCLISPLPNSMYNHLKSLIPKELIVLPKAFRLSGKLLIGGKIAIRDFLLCIHTDEQQARLILTLTHEISHKKRLIYANYNKYMPKTPEHFFSEAGFYIDRLIYGEFIKGAQCNIKNIDREIAESIFKVRTLTEEQACKIFGYANRPQSNQVMSLSELTDSDEEDYIPLCTSLPGKKY